MEQGAPDVQTGPSKGERLLQAAPEPKVLAQLPDWFRHQEYVSFDASCYDLRQCVTQLLDRADEARLGSFPDDAKSLETYAADEAVFRSFHVRQRLRQCVSQDVELLGVYEQLVKEVLCPHLKAKIVERTGSAEPVCFSFQYPPTVRLQPGPSKQFKRPHRDAEYGHQVGELNFWMPLTNYTEMTRTTLWVESAPNLADFRPLDIDYGNIAMFHGTLCNHRVPANASKFTRVSMDFRIGIGDFYDKEWALQGLKGEHGRREFWL
mmetsp:Transcript_44881/g.80833  ORF Transcript_44881/g.80833 Transcript_44881/m.80833 type:complete len:264 (-) Transcript_44881:29-820(-)